MEENRPAGLGSKTACANCGVAIKRTRRGRRFCSDACRLSWHRDRTRKAKLLLDRMQRGGDQ